MGAGAWVPRMTDWLEQAFPGLRDKHYKITSPRDKRYNCIAWAAHDMTCWWWPDAQYLYYWPAEAPRAYTVEAYAAAYSLQGFKECDSDAPESGYEKVAIFVDPKGKPTHAARQNADGTWTSKLGPNIDIEHDLHALEGVQYGNVDLLMKRRLPGHA